MNSQIDQFILDDKLNKYAQLLGHHRWVHCDYLHSYSECVYTCNLCSKLIIEMNISMRLELTSCDWLSMLLKHGILHMEEAEKLLPFM